MAFARLLHPCLLAPLLLIAAPAQAAVQFRAVSAGRAGGDLVLARPPGTQPGDALVATLAHAGPAVGAPAGWRPLLRTARGGVVAATWWRPAASGDPPGWRFAGAGRGTAGGIGAYAGVDPGAPVALATARSGTGGSARWPRVVAPGAGAVAVAHLVMDRPAAATPSGWTPRWNAARGGLTATGGEAPAGDAGPLPALRAGVPRGAWSAHVVLLQPPARLAAALAGTAAERVVRVTSTHPWGLRVAGRGGQWRRAALDGVPEASAFAEVGEALAARGPGRLEPLSVAVAFRGPSRLGPPPPVLRVSQAF